MKSNATSALIALIFTVIVWGITPVFARSVSLAMGPVEALIVRLILVAIVFVVLLSVTTGFHIDRKDWPRLLLISFVGMLGYFLAGCGHLLVVVALNTMLQGSVPDEYRGRVTSFYLLGILGGIPLGSQLLGSLGDIIGFRRTLLVDAFAFGAVLTTLIVSGWWRALDELALETH